MNFKQFLIEAAKGKQPQYFKVDVDEAIGLLNKYCKNALWMLEENAPIYRGDARVSFPKSGFLVVDTEATERVSENTSNFYTVILDNHPDRKEFPKRARSFIATTNKQRAMDYTWRDDPYVMIPSDSAKIGFVNEQDMWDTRIKLFGMQNDIVYINDHFETLLNLHRAPTIDDFYKFDALLKKDDSSAIRKFKDAFELSKKEVDDFKNNFLDEIWKAYSAEATGHKVYTTATMPHKSKSEVWVGGKVVLIKAPVWQKMVQAYNAK